MEVFKTHVHWKFHSIFAPPNPSRSRIVRKDRQIKQATCTCDSLTKNHQEQLPLNGQWLNILSLTRLTGRPTSNVPLASVFIPQALAHAEKYSRRLFGWTETCIRPGFHGNLFLELDATANVSHYNIPWEFKPNVISWHDMSRDMTKPTKWVCAQRWLRSAWAFAQSDQSLRCPHEESLGP